MSNIIPLKKPEPEESHGMTRLGSLFTIPEWMFDERPHLVSRDNPAQLRYVCQECGIVEPKAVANGFIRRECACERAMRDSLAHEQFRQETQAVVAVQKTARTYTWLGGQEDDLAEKTFDNFTESYQPKAYQEARAFAERIIRARAYGDTARGNLVLMGSYGTGKTHLAAACLNMLRAQCIPCLFCTAQELLNTYYSCDFDGKVHLIEQAATTPLLVLDELDKLYVRQETDGAYQKRTLFDILDKRYKQKLPTIITANEQQDLGTWLDGATISRLYERITAVPMNGVDYRSRGRK
jgi:DNA replication protein DnaC